ARACQDGPGVRRRCIVCGSRNSRSPTGLLSPGRTAACYDLRRFRSIIWLHRRFPPSEGSCGEVFGSPNQLREVSIQSRLARSPLAISWLLLLVPGALGGEGDTKPSKKTIRAADGLNIVCEVRGKGDTALVFLHGWCGDREYWKHQVDVFAADYRIVTLDQAGHGESGKDRKAWTVSGLAGDVESVVKAPGLKRVILVGRSV